MEKFSQNTESSDIKLFERFIAGDKDAMEALYKKYYDLMLNYGLKCDPDKDLVQDCIQDFFITAFGNHGIHSGNIVSVRAYLLRSVRNKLHDKTVLRKKLYSIDDIGFNLPADEDLFAQLFPKNDDETKMAREILKALSSLSPNRKTALYLRYVKGFSHKEIADVLNINEQSSMNLISRTFAKLRELLDESFSSEVIPQSLIILLMWIFWE